MQATIIAVGSELLVGQITNRNAAWISARLFAAGIATRRHVTVDDIEGPIVDALVEAEQASDLILVTGGLGPTTDDLTRHAVARWAAAALVWHEPSWTRIVAFFSSLARVTPESNRQQCYFPQGSTVLENPVGTASAFYQTVRGKKIWVLPGPPREVEAVWSKHIAHELEGLVPSAERMVYRMWRTIGRGESHVAEQVEALIEGHGIDVAYRAHPPYVETKLRFPAKDRSKHQALCDLVAEALKPWLFEADDDNCLRAFADTLAKRGGHVRLVDTLTRGQLAERLLPLWRELKPDSSLTVESAFFGGTPQRRGDDDLLLSVAPGRLADTWLASVSTANMSREAQFPHTYTGAAMRSRNEQAVAYLAFKRWPELMD